jgi:hypothetical protein
VSFLILVLLAAEDGSLEARARRANEEGMALAKTNQLEAAIARFKDAEKLVPRFEHHCNAGRAYALRKRWPQAWLFLDDCRVRGGRNVGPWVAALLTQVEGELRQADHRPVVLMSEGLVTVSFPSLAADERWRVSGKRTVWLPRTRFDLSLATEMTTWAGVVPPKADEFVVNPPPAPIADSQPRDPPPRPATSEPPVLTPTPDPVAQPAVVTTAPLPAVESSRPWVGPLVLGAVAAASLISSGFVYGVARQSLDEANALGPGPGFDAVNSRYERERGAFYSLLGAGGVLGVAAFIWWLVLPK